MKRSLAILLLLTALWAGASGGRAEPMETSFAGTEEAAAGTPQTETTESAVDDPLRPEESPESAASGQRLPPAFFYWAGAGLAVLAALALVCGKSRGDKRGAKAAGKKKTPVPAAVPEEVAYPPTVANFQHIGGRKAQEDSFGTSDPSDLSALASKGFLAVLADGMGGLRNGRAISQRTVNAMLARYEAAGPQPSGEALLTLLLQAAVQAVGREFDGGEKAGTTLLAVVQRREWLSFLTVGDSRIVLLRDGELITLNNPHTVGAEADAQVARGELTLTEAREQDRRAAVTSYLGNGAPRHVERTVTPLRLKPGDKLLLMSDGVFGALSDDELRCCLNEKAAAAAVQLQNLVLAKRRAHQDNFTGILLEI